jgi:hypothetical protein
MESVEYRADKFPRWRKKRRKRNFQGGRRFIYPRVPSGCEKTPDSHNFLGGWVTALGRVNTVWIV